jgi:hypothetical protein
MWHSLAHAAGGMCAFVVSLLVVLHDCHVTLATSMKRVPIPIVRSKEAWSLSLACGMVAFVAYLFTGGKGDSAIDAILTLKQPNDVVRGFSVGAMVLVLIRSKLTSIKGAEVGGEFLYTSARSWVIERVNNRWGAYKRAFNARNLTAALSTKNYPDLILEEISNSIRVRDELYREFVQELVKVVLKKKPKSQFDPERADWNLYYRSLTNLALDHAGPSVFSDLGGSRFDLSF